MWWWRTINRSPMGRMLTNIRNEPDAALFQVPPDYTVVDEAGGFTLNWGQ
jgi:hypothetical protein